MNTVHLHRSTKTAILRAKEELRQSEEQFRLLVVASRTMRFSC